MWRHITITTVFAAASLALAGCHDTHTGPRRDVHPPSAPSGVFSVTGDHRVWLYWDQNPESDVVGYRIYEGPCDSGPNCPYTRIGSTSGLSYEVSGLANGVTRYFAVAAVDRAGNESDLSYNSVFDTPRPEGFGLAILSVENDPDFSGYDFSRYGTVAFDDSEVDIVFTSAGGVNQIYAPYVDTDIQDMGPTASLDDIDWAPNSGWSPAGTVEAVPGHAYVVWTWDDHYAKFRVVNVNGLRVIVDWAYQVDPGNRELRARRAVDEDGTPAPRVKRAGITASR